MCSCMRDEITQRIDVGADVMHAGQWKKLDVIDISDREMRWLLLHSTPCAVHCSLTQNVCGWMDGYIVIFSPLNRTLRSAMLL